METVLQLIGHFEFIEENKKNIKIVLQTSNLTSLTKSRSSPIILKKLYKNQNYINKSLITYYIDYN